jgi:hypothetical protein
MANRLHAGCLDFSPSCSWHLHHRTKHPALSHCTSGIREGKWRGGESVSGGGDRVTCHSALARWSPLTAAVFLCFPGVRLPLNLDLSGETVGKCNIFPPTICHHQPSAMILSLNAVGGGHWDNSGHIQGDPCFGPHGNDKMHSCEGRFSFMSLLYFLPQKGSCLHCLPFRKHKA